MRKTKHVHREGSRTPTVRSSDPHTDVVAWIDKHIKKNERGQPFRLMDHQREILRLAFAFDASGRLPYDTILFSAPKKSGKTTLNACISLWWAYTQEPPNELKSAANDLEQAQGRVFKNMAGLIKHNPELHRRATVQVRQIVLHNQTTIDAIASDYRGEAGSDHGLTSWDELWGYVSEASRRLWEELTAVPTRKNSIRLLTSYAGWENESYLLWDLYKQGVDAEEHPDGQGIRIHPTLPIYHNPDARLFCYWDHEPRMAWQTPEYYASQRRSLRPGTYTRLHENRWVTAETTFITPDLWDPCVDRALTPLLPDKSYALFLGVDLGVKRDNAAVVAVRREGDQVILCLHRIWRPTKLEPLDIENTVEQFLRDLDERWRVQEVLVDPFQAHQMIGRLRDRMMIREFAQTTQGTTQMGQSVFDLLSGTNLRMYPSEELRQQALSTVAIESPRGFRIAKEKASKKIDAIVALAIACVAATEGAPINPDAQPEAVGQRACTNYPGQDWVDMPTPGLPGRVSVRSKFEPDW